jgi:uncharacterized membrane protein
MSTSWWVGLTSSFLASGVEVVESATVVLAVGVTRGWRSAWLGVGAAALCLAAMVFVLGPTLDRLIPLGALRVVIGTLLLIFGLQWLRTAMMRYTGLKERHDENRVYAQEISTLRAGTAPTPGTDWTAFAVAFKGVLLEGLEVVFIVITFGLTAGDATPALLGAIGAAVTVVAIAIVIQEPLSRVPENTLKFLVGLMLTAFGTLWAGEGVGLQWPGEDVAILGLIMFYTVAAGLVIMFWRSRSASGGARTVQHEVSQSVPSILVRLHCRGCVGSGNRRGHEPPGDLRHHALGRSAPATIRVGRPAADHRGVAWLQHLAGAGPSLRRVLVGDPGPGRRLLMRTEVPAPKKRFCGAASVRMVSFSRYCLSG